MQGPVYKARFHFFFWAVELTSRVDPISKRLRISRAPGKLFSTAGYLGPPGPTRAVSQWDERAEKELQLTLKATDSLELSASTPLHVSVEEHAAPAAAPEALDEESGGWGDEEGFEDFLGPGSCKCATSSIYRSYLCMWLEDLIWFIQHSR